MTTPYSNTYNLEWRNHPNFGWGGNQNRDQGFVHREQGQCFQRPSGGYQSASSSNYNNQLQMALHQPQPQAQPIIPPQEPLKKPSVEDLLMSFIVERKGQEEALKNKFNSKAGTHKDVSTSTSTERPYKRGITFNPPLKIVQEEEVSLPYPQALWKQDKKLKKEGQLREMIDLFKKVHLPPKLKDPRSFSIPSKIGDTTFDKCLVDLGSSINLMPYSCLRELGFKGSLKPTSISLQLANRSVRYPRVILENVLVNVATLVIAVNFVVLDMEETLIVDNEIPIIFMGERSWLPLVSRLM
ncbi:uncharacterized protein LOC126797066 [Argentina anserina]|uniref:uncharacterized protein LOC126797066 n=1 Tax=Argentina anserina TaxID=57926 RepID=UPI0021764C6B|nr:uncharacterized protein LOC126797066 [Potentilla anserina]